MRIAATTALTASLGALVLALAPSASAETGALTPEATVGYVAAQLESGGDRLQVTSEGETFDDLGLTIDAVLGMTAAGSGGDASEAATDYVVENAETYTGSGEEVYASATAKLLTFASARGLDPRDVDGTDLVEQLQSLEEDDGQFADSSAEGDFSNSLGQSLGLIGLERADVDPSPESVDFLLAQQCEDGGFALEYGQECTSNPDATSVAVQALDAVGGHESEMTEAVDYLADQQAESGGLGGGETTQGVNSNSTAQAAVAFGVAGRDDARAEAVDHLESLTFGCETPELAGAVAYDENAHEAATEEGEQAKADGQTTRATAPALLALSGESHVSVSADGQSAEAPSADCSGGSGDGSSGDASAQAQSGDDGGTQSEGAGFTTGEMVTTGLIGLLGVAAVVGVVLGLRRRARSS